MNRLKWLMVFCIGAGWCLWPAWIAFFRFDGIHFSMVAVMALSLLSVALVSSSPETERMYWLWPVVAWMACVNIQDGAMLEWGITWAVAFAGAYIARIGLARLSWMFHKPTRH